MQSQVHGGDVYSADYKLDFSTNTNPLGTPQSVQHAVLASISFLSQYPDVRCRELRRELSSYYRLPAEWFICTNGAAELIFALAHALRPVRALLLAPCFSEYENALRTGGCEDIKYYLCRREEGYAVREDILDYISSDIDVFFICNPNNPTGLSVDRSLMKKILDKCSENKVLMVVDECFVGLMEHPENVSVADQVADHPNLVILNAFTKLYAIPGLRLGYGITSDLRLLERITACLQPWNVSVPAQRAGVAALKEKAYVEESRLVIARELRYLKQNFERIGITYYDSEVNYLLFEGPEDLYETCAKNGFLIRDCSNYRGLNRGVFRVSVRTRRENEELCGFFSTIFREKGQNLPSYAH